MTTTTTQPTLVDRLDNLASLVDKDHEAEANADYVVLKAALVTLGKLYALLTEGNDLDTDILNKYKNGV